MPTNHGIYRKLTEVPSGGKTELPACRYGILRIFDALTTKHFSQTQEERNNAADLAHHFRTVFVRFVFSMQELNRLMHELADICSNSNGPGRAEARRIIYQSECLADHVMNYLNTIVDDVAIITVQATKFNVRSIESMNNLYKNRNA